MPQPATMIFAVIAGVLLVGLLILLVKLYQQNSRLLYENKRFDSEMNHRVQSLFIEWQERETERIRLNEQELANRDAISKLHRWKVENETSIRSDANKRSQSVTIGKVTEHLVPYFRDFVFNPKDVRFLGSPVDLVVFDGMNDENVQEIVFVEVKTGPSATLSKRERQIKDAIANKRVRWLELRIDRAD